MIISHEHKFIFLKTKKTAGTSLELALRTLCGNDDIITSVLEDEDASAGDARGPQNWEVHSWWQSRRPLRKRRWFKRSAHDLGFYNHMPAAAAKALLNDDKIWNSYFKFAFDRNPWDRQVSHFYYRCRNKPDNKRSFDDFMHRDQRARLNNFEIYSLDGASPCVDFLGHYEDLAGGLNKALAQVGLSFGQPLPRAKTTQRTNNMPYRDFYDDETRDMVGDWYGREIKLLDYGF